jgi:hypothetical protein
MVVPDATTHGIQHNTLETVIVSDGPMAVGCPRQLWHRFLCQHGIMCHKVSGFWFNLCHAMPFDYWLS